MLRFLLLSLIAVAGVSAQDTPYTLKVDVSAVSVDVSVFGPTGPVNGLTQKDFVIYEDGRPQEIQSFASSESAYNTLLVIDRSGSMASTFPLLLKAVNRFIANLRTQDRFALAAFDRSVKRLVDWRSVRSGPAQTVKLGAGGDTDFYRALDWASQELGKIRGRKTALFYTDGEDYRLYDPAETDAKAFNRVLQTVRRARAPFHFVGLNVDPKHGGFHLQRIAEETGGQAHFIENLEEVVPIYDQISRDLGTSYTLGYVSDKAERNNSYRRIEVRIPGTDYRISQSRMGYTAR
jgi:VWFA-related protein